MVRQRLEDVNNKAMRNIIYVYTLFIFLNASSMAQNTNKKYSIIKGKDYEGAIYFKKPWNGLDGYGIEQLKFTVFIPSKKEVDNMEKILFNKLVKLDSIRLANYDSLKHPNHPVLRCHLDKLLKVYKRKYYGYINNNKKYIYLYIFDSQSFDYEHEVLDLGGGCSFFTVHYSVEKKKFFKLYIDYSEM